MIMLQICGRERNKIKVSQVHATCYLHITSWAHTKPHCLEVSNMLCIGTGKEAESLQQIILPYIHCFEILKVWRQAPYPIPQEEGVENHSVGCTIEFLGFFTRGGILSLNDIANRHQIT